MILHSFDNMATGNQNMCSPVNEISEQTKNDNDSKKLKTALLYLSEDDLFWKGDLTSLKKFVEVDLHIDGRWSSPRGETTQFSNPEFFLKWHGPVEEKLSITQDNDENELYSTLKSYATLTKSTNDENQNTTINHVSVRSEDEAVQAELAYKNDRCEQCKHHQEETHKLVTLIAEIIKKQDNDRDYYNQMAAENDAKIKALVKYNNKMAAEIESLKANVEETSNDNVIIKSVLDIKQGEWTKVEHLKSPGSEKSTESAKEESGKTNIYNRFQALCDENIIVNTDEIPVENGEANSVIKEQITDYRKKQTTKFQISKDERNLKKTPKGKVNQKIHNKSNTNQPITEKTDLVIGDSMVKNIDSRKLERAARRKVVCHSYSGATVRQIQAKVNEHWNEDHHYERIVIHVGTNDLAREEPNEVVEKMETLINEVKVHTKEVAISSVVKRYDGKVKASSITQYNKLLHSLCVKHKITFIDNDCIDKTMLNRSNLHLNRNGDKALGSAFCMYLKPKHTPIIPRSNNDHFLWETHGHRRKDWLMYLRYVKQVLNH